MSERKAPWLVGVLLAGGAVVAAATSVLWLNPPLAMAGLAGVQNLTDGAARMVGAERPEQLCSLSRIYRGAKQRAVWNAATEKGLAEGKLLAEKDGMEQWQTPYGDWWIPEDNWSHLPMIIGQMVAGYYGPDTTAVCEEGDVVLDAGAHVGTFARQALDDGAKLVVVIEPSPKNLVALRMNLATDIAQGRVIVAPVGVWDKEEMLPIYSHDEHTAADSFVEEGGTPSEILQLTTVDKLVSELGLEQVDVIKMDIKGATLKAIHGATGVIQQHRPRLSLATEQGDAVDNPRELTAAVRAIHPDYARTCGDGSMVDGRPRPNIIFFQ